MSLRIACMKNYVQATKEVMHIIDETSVIKMHTGMVGELYHKANYTELPAVTSSDALFLSKIFSRINKGGMPISIAKTWLELKPGSYRGSCMCVIESMSASTKLVPDAMFHPMSHLISTMD